MLDSNLVAKQILDDNWEDLQDLDASSQATIQYAIKEQLEKAFKQGLSLNATDSQMRPHLIELAASLARQEAFALSKPIDTCQQFAELLRAIRLQLTEAMKGTP